MTLADRAIAVRLAPADLPWEPLPGRREAAVIVAWVARADGDRLLLCLRRHDLAQHAGEIAFPGGMREGDESALDCALRETREEVGLGAEAFTVLGRLPVRDSSTGFHVHPFAARLDPAATPVPDPSEVAEVLEVPFGNLVRGELWSEREFETIRGPRRAAFFDRGGDPPLWGLSGRIVLDLLALIPGARD